ncbi:MAG: hypothetical protein ACRELB_07375, partial [Polyangiaceae bacterium]
MPDEIQELTIAFETQCDDRPNLYVGCLHLENVAITPLADKLVKGREERPKPGQEKKPEPTRAPTLQPPRRLLGVFTPPPPPPAPPPHEAAPSATVVAPRPVLNQA